MLVLQYLGVGEATISNFAVATQFLILTALQSISYKEDLMDVVYT
jgi:hypothetical protein